MFEKDRDGNWPEVEVVGKYKMGTMIIPAKIVHKLAGRAGTFNLVVICDAGKISEYVRRFNGAGMVREPDSQLKLRLKKNKVTIKKHMVFNGDGKFWCWVDDSVVSNYRSSKKYTVISINKEVDQGDNVCVD